jgi:predicted enzyme related to lactoylglutathione lyase
MTPQSQITFLYYYDLDVPSAFYEDVMGFEMVEDQGPARIYRVAGNAYLGIVNERTGFHRAQPKNAVLVTLLVDDVEWWYEYLTGKGARVVREPELKGKSIHRHRRFVIQDPGGYTIEIQQFLHPDTVRIYHRES